MGAYSHITELYKSEPGEYLLSADEAITIARAYDCIMDVEGLTLDKNGKTAVNDENVSRIIKAIANKKIGAKRLCNIADKVLNGEWFTYVTWLEDLAINRSEAPIISQSINDISPGDESNDCEWVVHGRNQSRGQVLFESTKHGAYQTSDNAWIKFTEESSPQFFTLDTIHDRKTVLNIANRYLFLYQWELFTVNIIKRVYEFPNQKTNISTLIAIDGIPNSAFMPIRQGYATNAFSKINTRKNRLHTVTIDEYTGSTTFTAGDLRVEINRSDSESTEITATTQRLLDAIYADFTFKGGKDSRNIEIPLDEYMKLCNLSDRKETLRSVKKDLKSLLTLSLSVTHGKENWYDVRIFDRAGIWNGVICASFASSFLESIARYSVSYIPKAYFESDLRNNPNSSYFCKKISFHKGMNIGKSNENIISVQSLLNSTPELPTYSEMKERGRVKEKIIAPFERDMNALHPVFTWEYSHTKGEPLTQSELENMTYDTFKSLMVNIKWVDYPKEIIERELKKKDAHSQK